MRMRELKCGLAKNSRLEEMDKIWVCDKCGATLAGGFALRKWDFDLHKEVDICIHCCATGRVKFLDMIEEYKRHAQKADPVMDDRSRKERKQKNDKRTD